MENKHFEFWDNGDGTVSLEVGENDIPGIILFWTLDELQQMLDFQVKLENYTGAEIIHKSIKQVQKIQEEIKQLELDNETQEKINNLKNTIK